MSCRIIASGVVLASILHPPALGQTAVTGGYRDEDGNMHWGESRPEPEAQGSSGGDYSEFEEVGRRIGERFWGWLRGDSSDSDSSADAAAAWAKQQRLEAERAAEEAAAERRREEAIRSAALADRDAGLRAMALRDWSLAVSLLEASLRVLPGDAETLTALEGARRGLVEQAERRRRIIGAFDPFSGRGWDGERWGRPRERASRTEVDVFDPFGTSRLSPPGPVASPAPQSEDAGVGWERTATADELASPTMIVEAGAIDSTFVDGTVVDLRDAKTVVLDPAVVRGASIEKPMGTTVEQATPALDAAQVRTQIKALQKAISDLSAAGEFDSEQRRQWEQESDAAVRDAIELGIDQAASLLATRLDKQTTRALHEAINEATDPVRKKELGLAFAALRRAGLRNAELEQARLAYSFDTWANSDTQDLEWTVSGIRTVVSIALKSPAVSAVDTAAGAWIDTSAQLLSVQRIEDANRRTEEKLRAMNAMKLRMESLVDDNREVLKADPR